MNLSDTISKYSLSDERCNEIKESTSFDPLNDPLFNKIGAKIFAQNDLGESLHQYAAFSANKVYENF